VPAGFALGDPATYYELTTTATFTPPITVCLDYTGVNYQDESALRLLHFEEGAWVDQTFTLETETNIICAIVSSLSPFAVAERQGTTLGALGSANIWLGLKNSDDVGTRFDVLAEILKDGAVVGSGQVNNVPGGSSGFNNAILRTIPLALNGDVPLASGDTVSLRVWVRAGATGHRSGTARLWYNDAAAHTRFGATIDDETNDYYLVFTPPFGLTKDVPGGGPKKTIDVTVNRNVGGNPFKPFGTWTLVVP
jgi:hypothetical protein